MRKASLGYCLVVTIIAFTLLSCTQDKNMKFASNQPIVTSPSCGAIDMSPPHSLYPHIMVNFEVIPPSGFIPQEIQWTFRKGTAVVHTATTPTVSRLFNGPNEGHGQYTATAVFTKPDGNSCELEKNFQIRENDVCVKPSGISGPTVGYIDEETSPFSVNAEPCFQGQIQWDMNNDGVLEHTLSPSAFFTHTYNQTGVYTVKAFVIDFEDDAPTTLIHEIEIKNKSCLNPFTNEVVQHGQSVEFAKESAQCGGNSCDKKLRACLNGQFETENGAGLYILNPATCPLSIPCPASYAWVPSEFGQCTGPCDSHEGTQEIINFICHKTFNGEETTVADAECLDSLGAKPTGQTQACEVAEEDLALNCLSCGDVPHNSVVVKWAKNYQCGKKCTFQERTCSNGDLPAFDVDYIYDSEALCPIAECPPQFTYAWKEGAWGECSATACGTSGTQKRSVICVRNDGLQVLDMFCKEPKPATSKSCSARDCNSCNLPWGGSIAHKESVKAYKKSNVSYGSTCASETRTCNDGTLSGTYTNKTCKIDEPASCQLDGVTVSHGQKRVFFKSASAMCPQSCLGQERTCSNGKLSGSDSYGKATCSEQACSYKWVVSDWSACSATACNTQGVQTRSVKCQRSDGSYVADSSCSSPKPEDKKTCSARACNSCQLPWGGAIAHDSEIEAFKESIVGCNEKCISQKRKCKDGKLTGAFTKPSCTIKTCDTDTCKVDNVISTCSAVINDSSKTHYRIAPLNWRFFNPTGDAFTSGKVASFNPFSGGKIASSALKYNKKTGAVTPMTNGMTVGKDEVMYCYNYYDDTSRQLVRHSPSLGYVLVDVPDKEYSGASPYPHTTCRYPPPKTVILGTSATMKCTSNGAIPDPAMSDSKNRILWENFNIGGYCGY